MEKQSGAFISRGVNVNSLDINKKWDVHVTVSVGEYISGGTIIAETQETRAIVHKSMVPPYIKGTVIDVAEDDEYTINDTIVTIRKDDGSTLDLTLTQKWPIREPRPITKRYGTTAPLVTGQRIMDTLFP
ncbi:MAG: V-type ATP synthase subunit A, partial [Eubacterium sp.]